MLILQRKKGQSLNIGEDVTVTVTDCGSDWVRLAIDAPKEISVLRSELLEAASANEEARSSVDQHSLNEVKELFLGKD